MTIIHGLVEFYSTLFNTLLPKIWKLFSLQCQKEMLTTHTMHSTQISIIHSLAFHCLPPKVTTTSKPLCLLEKMDSEEIIFSKGGRGGHGTRWPYRSHLMCNPPQLLTSCKKNRSKAANLGYSSVCKFWEWKSSCLIDHQNTKVQ